VNSRLQALGRTTQSFSDTQQTKSSTGRDRSLQSLLQDEILPNIASLTQNLFNNNVWDDSNHTRVFLYFPERFNKLHLAQIKQLRAIHSIR